VARLYGAYRDARRPLQRAVKEAKRRVWDELLTILDSDPWVRSYRMVLNKLRLWAPPATESMDPRFLEEVVGALFPGTVNEEANREGEEQEPLPPEEKEELPNIAGSWSPESGVSVEELAEAVGRIGVWKVPGPDGVPARVWRDVAGVLAPRLRCLFSRYLAWDEFPVLWKEGRMVLSETRTVSRLAFCISSGVPFGQGWQTARKSGGRSSQVAFVPACPRTVRCPVRLP
jgi:hypothetical protein